MSGFPRCPRARAWGRATCRRGPPMPWAEITRSRSGTATRRWITNEQYSRDSTLRMATIVEFEPYGAKPGVALIEPATMQALLSANRYMVHERWPVALTQLSRAESVLSDPRAIAFLGTLASRKARCLLELGERGAAIREAHRALAISPYYFDARFVLAREAFDAGRLPEAESRLDSLLRIVPGDRSALELLVKVRAARAGPAGRAR